MIKPIRHIRHMRRHNNKTKQNKLALISA